MHCFCDVFGRDGAAAAAPTAGADDRVAGAPNQGTTDEHKNASIGSLTLCSLLGARWQHGSQAGADLEELRQELAGKDEAIASLTRELEQSNQLLQRGSAAGAAAATPELSETAALVSAQLQQSGRRLTDIVRVDERWGVAHTDHD